MEAVATFGVGNNQLNPLLGSAGSTLRRVTAPSYPGDGSGEFAWNAPEPTSDPMTPPNLPFNIGTSVQPLTITTEIYGPGSDVNTPSAGGLSEFAQWFGQFLAHDMVQIAASPSAPPLFVGRTRHTVHTDSRCGR